MVHRCGSVHRNADELSPLLCRQCGRESHETHIVAEVGVATLQLSDSRAGESLCQMQLADPVTAPLLQGNEAGTKPDVRSFSPKLHGDSYRFGIN